MYSYLSDRTPVPIGADLGPPEEAAPPDLPLYMRPVEVRGVLSPRGFFNHPEAAYCSRSGVKMGASHTLKLVVGERPPLGVFTFDDGSTCAVQWNMVIGREPRGDERVASGEAAPFPPTDAKLKVSRRHLLVELVDWGVYVQDLDTGNGTWVREGSADGAGGCRPESAIACRPAPRSVSATVRSSTTSTTRADGRTADGDAGTLRTVVLRTPDAAVHSWPAARIPRYHRAPDPARSQPTAPDRPVGPTHPNRCWQAEPATAADRGRWATINAQRLLIRRFWVHIRGGVLQELQYRQRA